MPAMTSAGSGWYEIILYTSKLFEHLPSNAQLEMEAKVTGNSHIHCILFL